MRTKEIEVWIQEERFNKMGFAYITKDVGFPQLIEGQKCFKAKLIIEIPERKVEITESQFDEAWREAVRETVCVVSHIKQKLFGGGK